MAKKIKKSAANTSVQNITSTVSAPAVAPKLIVCQRKYDRWYVYFQGVAPKDNVGCPCKTALSAMRYMHLLRERYGAVISENCYARLQFEIARR